ncbi:thermonuclease family protein [Aurantiacibacter gangjinensis]|uniref:TNase-like domain-containing protein n=1 Tax=Aurantiacibacter gangjinensis TaxID=502682 RepID=A0A0G9MRK2_9SPHN|nr:thermonuclease family protein [Aurantiacibacter gangjinensis]KLE33174.1 hypothetical protein AAW01_04150 [Aurantiacibacter gangjinensis]
MLTASLLLALTAAPQTPCTVTDGDTIRCGEERVRVTGIDAPETRACRQGRRCVEGDGAASTRAMEALVDGAELTFVRLGQDRYGRTLAVVYANGVNVACVQLAARQACYVERWDDRRLVAADCPALAASRAVS